MSKHVEGLPHVCVSSCLITVQLVVCVCVCVYILTVLQHAAWITVNFSWSTELCSITHRTTQGLLYQWFYWHRTDGNIRLSTANAPYITTNTEYNHRPHPLQCTQLNDWCTWFEIIQQVCHDSKHFLSYDKFNDLSKTGIWRRVAVLG